MHPLHAVRTPYTLCFGAHVICIALYRRAMCPAFFICFRGKGFVWWVWIDCVQLDAALRAVGIAQCALMHTWVCGQKNDSYAPLIHCTFVSCVLLLWL